MAAAEREQRALRLGEQPLDQDRQVDVRDPVRRLLRQEDVAGRVRDQQLVVRHQLLPAGQRLGGRVQEARERTGDRVAVHDRDADDEGARARPGGIEHRRPARQELLEPAMVAQAHAALERARRLAPDRPAVAVEHRDTHAEERGAVVGGFEEHLLGGAGAVEQVHLGALRQPLEVALEQLQVETQRLRVHLRLARHAQLQLLADGRDVGPVAEHGARQGDEAGHRQPGDDGARELPGAGDHARGRRSAGSHGGHVP